MKFKKNKKEGIKEEEKIVTRKQFRRKQKFNEIKKKVKRTCVS